MLHFKIVKVSEIIKLSFLIPVISQLYRMPPKAISSRRLGSLTTSTEFSSINPQVVDSCYTTLPTSQEISYLSRQLEDWVQFKIVWVNKKICSRRIWKAQEMVRIFLRLIHNTWSTLWTELLRNYTWLMIKLTWHSCRHTYPCVFSKVESIPTHSKSWVWRNINIRLDWMEYRLTESKFILQ